MLIDTHCHLNFKAFDGKINEVIKRANESGVDGFIVPGTDVETSKKAVEMGNKFPSVFAAVGIHPHHVFQAQNSKLKVQSYSSKLKVNKKRVLEEGGIPSARSNFSSLPLVASTGGMESSNRPRFLDEIENLLINSKVVAVGEVGLDRHYYQQTKYKDYQISDDFIELQKTLFKEQIKLAVKYKKSLIIHTRETAEETLDILNDVWNEDLRGRSVFHCCEADDRLLKFALAHDFYIGVDGDITYNKKKQEFIKKCPLERLVLETDSPFLLPEPLRSQKLYPNEPKNLKIIAQSIADLKKASVERISIVTSENARNLFRVNG